MNILIVHCSYIPTIHEGGHTISLQNFAEEFVSQGHTVTVCATNKDGHNHCKAGYFRKNGVKIYKFPIKVITKWAFAPGLFIFLKKEIKKYDIVHIWSIFGFYSFVAARLAKKYRIPFVVSPQGNFSPVALKKNKILKKIYLKTFEKNTFNSASAVHCTTKIDKLWAYSQGIPYKKSFVVPNGIALPSPYSFVTDFSYSDYIFYLGRIHPIKGLDFLIDVMASLPNCCNSTKLLLGGSDNDHYLKKILLYAKQKKILGRVIYLGNLERMEKYEYIRKARFLVLSSYSENFGIVVEEAMACGIPVIISDKCNIKTHVIKANCGFVLPHDIKKFREKFILLINDSKICNSLGENGLKYFKNNLTIEKVASQMLKKYKKIINAKV